MPPPDPDTEEDRPETDPTQAKWITDECEDRLVELFEWAKKELEKLLPSDEDKTHATPASKLPQILKKVNLVFQYVNDRGAEVFGEKLEDGTWTGEIPKAFQQGQVYAGIQLGAPYEVRKVAWEQVGNRIIEGQSDLKKLTDDTAGEVRRIIADGIIQERKFGDITRDIVRKTETVGINRAVTIARTETMRAVNDGVMDRYKKNDVEYVKWLAAADERTCDQCADLDGRTFPIDDAPTNPAHPSCRCTWTPNIRPTEADLKQARGLDEERQQPEEVPVSVENRLNEFTDKYKRSDTEHIQIYDKNGRVLHTVDGGRDSARVPDGNLKDAILIHNHPEGGTAALSPEDVSIAINKDLASMTCVDTRGVKMTIERPGSGWPKLSLEDINAQYSKSWNTLKTNGYIDDLKNDVLSGAKTTDAANKAATRVQVRSALEDLGLNPVVKK